MYINFRIHSVFSGWGQECIYIFDPMGQIHYRLGGRAGGRAGGWAGGRALIDASSDTVRIDSETTNTTILEA